MMAGDGDGGSGSSSGEVTLRLPLEDARRVLEWLDGLPYSVRRDLDDTAFGDALGEAVRAAEAEGAAAVPAGAGAIDDGTYDVYVRRFGASWCVEVARTRDGERELALTLWATRSGMDPPYAAMSVEDRLGDAAASALAAEIMRGQADFPLREGRDGDTEAVSRFVTDCMSVALGGLWRYTLHMDGRCPTRT